MAQIDKIQIGSTTYDILQSSDAIFTGTSNDTDDSSATEWINVVRLNSSESNGSIFTKLSSMFKNIRYLYSKIGNLDVGDIGTSISDAINNLAENKADKNHTHDTSTLDATDGTPLISNVQTADPNHVPSSLLVNNMNNQLSELVTSVNNKANIDHTHSNSSTTAPGFLPKLTGGIDKFLRADGTWAGAGSTYAVASTSANGLLKKLNGSASMFMNGAGNWATPAGTTNVVSTAANGLAPKLNNSAISYLNGQGNWTAPVGTTYTNFSSGKTGLVPAPSAAQATTGYILTGAGWAAGTKYNTDTNTTYGTNVGCYGTLDGTTLTLNTRNFRV